MTQPESIEAGRLTINYLGAVINSGDPPDRMKLVSMSSYGLVPAAPGG